MTARRTISSFRREKARQLRANATDPEMRLWRHLRRSPMLGSHFRRQVPIGPYVADFACMAARLIIEVDGSQHGETAVKARDEMRTQWLESEGYRVLRVWNNELIENMEGVLEAIHAALYGSRDSDPTLLKHKRQSNEPWFTPPRRAAPALRVDPPPAGEGDRVRGPSSA